MPLQILGTKRQKAMWQEDLCSYDALIWQYIRYVVILLCQCVSSAMHTAVISRPSQARYKWHVPKMERQVAGIQCVSIAFLLCRGHYCC